ncbi:hypothetical protein M408DRAFT_328248, partial [Serendipita vermifera MAFF 305830]
MNLRSISHKSPIFISTRSFAHSRRILSAKKPWFVDEEEHDEQPIAGLSTPKQASPTVKPPPANAPAYLVSTYMFLAQSPLIDPATLHLGSPLPANAHPDPDLPLPILKKVLKSRGRMPKEAGYGRGVGEGPGQGVYQWEVVAQVKEGAEMRGAVEVVSASVRNMLRREFPQAPRPPKPLHKDQKDGWELLDLGNAAVHICSRKAWERWMDPSRQW